MPFSTSAHQQPQLASTKAMRRQAYRAWRSWIMHLLTQLHLCLHPPKQITSDVHDAHFIEGDLLLWRLNVVL